MSKPTIQEQFQKKILVLDGAMGTMIQDANLTEEDFGGEEYDGCNEYLNLTAPDVIENIHRAYLEAGADIIETNTFGATSIVLEEYDLADKAVEINEAAVKLARNAVDQISTAEWPRYVAGAIGPTTKALSVTGGTTFEALIDTYYEQAVTLIKAGVDLLLIETSQDLRNVKAASLGIDKAFKELGKKLPIIISGTIEPMGTTLAGQTIEAFYISIEHLNPVAVGLNCATGPEFMRDHIRSLSELATTNVSCYPNAGLPDEEGNYHESPQSLAKKLAGFAEEGWLNMVGGCCGTTPNHIKEIAETVKQYEPRKFAENHPHVVSGIDPLIYDDSMRPLFVGERTNVIGSRKFKRLIADGKYEEASEIARAQVKKGAHVIDVCLADPDREEMEDMEAFLSYVVNKVKVPLMIDSTDEDVIAKALTYSQGKAIINSINLEDGEERFEKVIPLVHQFGAAVVVGTIDEQGMAVTAKRKLEVAKRSYDLLVNKYGLNPKDIIFDPLVFPVGTGDEQYIGAAKETIDGIKLIKEHLPECLTILGVSNVSFGIPPAGREVLNAVYLYHCTKAGLDYAIVNTEKLERYASIPESEKALSDKLLYDTSKETLDEFVAFYREKKVEKKVPTTSMSLEERIGNYVIEGSKDGLIADLDEALKKYDKPLDIINGPLMAGMEEVGRLFNLNELIVAEVLQSAEVMKAAVAHLEQFMEATDDKGKGKILLATVKGDVHDIGKNLVEIILGNNGFNIVNLGIKVTPSELIEACRKHSPDAIGLSGLLVKSAQQMVLTAKDLKEAGIDVPVLVGGAALSRKFTQNKIAPEYSGLVLYAKDAMDGLDIANKLHNPIEKQKIIEVYNEKQQERKVEVTPKAPTAVLERPKRSTIEKRDVYQAPDLKKHILRDYPLSYLKPYINLQMLLGRHLGVNGKIDRLLKEGDERTVQLKQLTDELFLEGEKNNLISCHGIYQFFPAKADGDDVLIFDPNDQTKLIERFSFPRQDKEPHLCLSDFLRDDITDYVGFFSVTAGRGIREYAEQLKRDGEFLKSHALQALALELAEGFAERMHQVMRDQWGFPDPATMSMQERFSAKYQGIRVSFGYPACPNLEDQEKLFKLIKPEDIGIQLTDGFMMEPEASVTAMVFAHPQARYFNVQV
ncbi:methionine synthase [Bacillus taeanensis]|uniref:Methionine synthase n=1 Tax=Bacillus taeanensis TaxID=273032 RepID=A0A366Y1M1_9BACI|nr:methionine synthase [Bacillus taeanensis]RBW70304.1 methionine synthase [Bacillus taeanensis]